MSLANLGLLLSFIVEGISAIKKFISDEEVRIAFKGLKEAETDAEREQAAKYIASCIYN